MKRGQLLEYLFPLANVILYLKENKKRPIIIKEIMLCIQIYYFCFVYDNLKRFFHINADYFIFIINKVKNAIIINELEG